jgi:hypothetical protein
MFQRGPLKRIILDLSSLHELQQTALHNLYTILKPGGSIEIHCTTQQNGGFASLKDLYTIAGFKEESSGNSTALILKKPEWAGKGVASLKKRNTNENNSTAVKINIEDTVVKVNGVKSQQMEIEKTAEKTEEKKTNPFAKFKIQNTDDRDLINEDNLLQNETGYNRLGNDQDCTTKPKACANCTCGRAELEAQGAEEVALEKKIEKGNVQSSCGNCYLGDAFRCASCPYKGLPAFKPGDKIKLDLSKDSLGGVLKEENKVIVSNGKVKLEI